MASPDALTAETLLAHASWIRDLARQMARDPHTAEDLAQDALVLALERPPDQTGSLRHWIASVMRNLVRQRKRSEMRRLAREELSARDEALEATDRLVERVSVQRELAQAVLELAEPYRSAILLRFYERLPPREIARRTGVPATTVRSRIARGIQQLRDRLDEDRVSRGDGRGAWLVALLAPLERSAEPATVAWSIGGIALNAKLILALSLTLVGTVAVAAWKLGGGEPARPTGGALVAADRTGEPARKAAAIEPVLPTDEARREARVPAAAPADPLVVPLATSAVETFTVRGRVLAADGRPEPGIVVRLEGETGAVATSAAAGKFELQTRAARGLVVAADEELVTVYAGAWNAQSGLVPVCVVAPAIRLAGRVTEELGGSLSRAQVRYELPPGFETRFDANLESSARFGVGWSAFSADNGAFELTRVPAIPGSELSAVLDGYLRAKIEAPARSDGGLLIVLGRPVIGLAGSLAGSVVDHEGRPAPGARVTVGLTSTATDEHGLFELDLARAVTDDKLTAIQAGARPAIEEKPPGGWPEFVELTLGGPPLEITGRVLDHEGAPVSGLRMWIAEPTPFGMIGQMPMFAENVMAGSPVPPMAVESVAFLPAQDGDDFWDYTTSPGPPSAFWTWIQTDAGGRFALPGLEDRAYRLSMMHDDTLVAHTTEPIRAGSADIVVTLPAPELHRHLKGRVVTAAGIPIEGVRVRLSRTAFDHRARVFGGTMYVGIIQQRESTTTGADGRFEFEDVPRDGLELAASSDRIVPTNHALTGDEDPTDVVIRVEARCHVDVRLSPPTARAARIGFVDRDGKRLDVLVIQEGSNNAYTSVSLVDGRSGVVSVSSEAAELVLMTADEEPVERVPITLVPGEVTVLEP